MPNIDIHPVFLTLIAILPAFIVFLIQKAISNKQKDHFLMMEKETFRLNATILDLEKEILTLKKELDANPHSADIVRMDDKQKSKII